LRECIKAYFGGVKIQFFLFLLGFVAAIQKPALCQRLNSDSLERVWRKTLDVPEQQVPSAILQISKNLGKQPAEVGLQTRLLALKMAGQGTTEARQNFSLLALCFETEFQRYINKDSLQQSLIKYITEATLANKLFLAAEACFRLSAFAEQRLDYATSAYFGLKGRDLLLQTGAASKTQLYGLYARLASVAFNTAQFRDCVEYASAAMAYQDEKAPIADLFNTLGLGYRGLGLQDSALYWFRKALDIAVSDRNKAAIGVVQGNMAQVYFARGNLAEAYPLLQTDVQESLAASDVPNAMNSLQFIARIQAMQGNHALSLATLHMCFANLPAVNNMRYRQNIMEGAALVYRLAGMHDSAWLAMKQQITYRDSMQARITNSRMGTVIVQLNYEKSLQTLKELSLEKQLAEQRRNLLVSLILLLGLAAWLNTNRQRLHMKYRQQMLMHEREKAEQEAAAARRQLELMRENLLTKSAMVEELQQKLSSNQLSNDTRQHLEVLQQSVILTEDDWLRYRELFEKVHPGFVSRLRQAAPDISQAELRIAVLMRLQFENRQMAGMLGISADSVAKSRRRLKARLKLPEETSLMQYVLEV
jgi:DNA-binding CsgD family transcriptional regulator